MRLRGAAIVVGTAVAAAALASDSGAARSDCSSAGSTSLVTTADARVYERSDGRAVACSYRYGRHVVLDTSFGHSFGPYTVNDHYVAFLRRYREGAATYHDVVEQSLITGRQRFEVQNGPSENCGGEDDCGAPAVGRLLMKENGSLAWIACYGLGPRCGRRPSVAVLRRDRRGPRLLDRGARIPVNSLRITRAGRRIVWEKRGVERSATLR